MTSLAATSARPAPHSLRSAFGRPASPQARGGCRPIDPEPTLVRTWLRGVEGPALDGNWGPRRAGGRPYLDACPQARVACAGRRAGSVAHAGAEIGDPGGADPVIPAAGVRRPEVDARVVCARCGDGRAGDGAARGTEPGGFEQLGPAHRYLNVIDRAVVRSEVPVAVGIRGRGGVDGGAPVGLAVVRVGDVETGVEEIQKPVGRAHPDQVLAEAVTPVRRSGGDRAVGQHGAGHARHSVVLLRVDRDPGHVDPSGSGCHSHAERGRRRARGPARVVSDRVGAVARLRADLGQCGRLLFTVAAVAHGSLVVTPVLEARPRRACDHDEDLVTDRTVDLLSSADRRRTRPAAAWLGPDLLGTARLIAVIYV